MTSYHTAQHNQLVSFLETVQRKPSRRTRFALWRANPAKPKLKILSIDGGGIRGIIPATVLCYLEEQLQIKSGNPQARLSDYFDFLAGTSTGGILVSLYLTPDDQHPEQAKYSAREVLELYMKDGPSIFRQNLSKKIKSLYGLLGKKYCAGNLKQMLQKSLGAEIRMSQLIRPCLIPAYDLHRQEAIFFNNQMDPAYDLKTWEIACATSSAPTYFEPAVLPYGQKELLLADGGLFAKNPSLQAFLEAQKKHAAEGKGHLQAEDTIVLSLGTGISQKRAEFGSMRKKGIAAWLKPLMGILTTASANVVQQQMKQLFAHTSQQYFRLDPELERADESIDNVRPQNIKALHEAGLSYVANNEEVLNSIVARLLAG